MKLRRFYVFDGDQHPQGGVKSYDTFAVSPDEKTFFIRGGNNGGLRLLVHFSPEGKMYLGYSLHQGTLVEANYYQTTSVSRMLKCAASMAPEDKLVPMGSAIPGFNEPRGAETVHRHDDGWYSVGDFALQLDSPTWAPNAQAWDIREGVYVRFADGTMRLISRRDYYGEEWRVAPPPKARQGDLLFFQDNTLEEKGFTIDGFDGEPDLVSYERHQVSGNKFPEDILGKDRWYNPTVTHPEHEEVVLPGIWYFVFVPGTSRPFARQDDRLD
jgi:hypothetical protein